MFSHIMIGSDDVDRSKKFYDALFAAMGAQPGTVDAKGRLVYSHNGGRFMVSKPIDGKPATVLNGGTIGFLMSDGKWPRRGTRPALRMAGRRSRIRLACARMALFLRIFVTPMVTSSSRLLGK